MRKLRLSHPGKHLREILEELGISHSSFASSTGLTARTIRSICEGRRNIDAPVALRIARALDMTPQFWLNYQSFYDLEQAELDLPKSELAKIKPIAA